MTKKEVLQKIAAFTQHGAERQKNRAYARDEFSKTLKDKSERDNQADYKYPGISTAFTGVSGAGDKMGSLINHLQARKSAYKSQQKGLENLKGMIPFIGMGQKGQKALDQVNKDKK